MDEVKKAALRYAKLGLRVFPVIGKWNENRFKWDKVPATPNGFKDATSNPDKVKDLFDRSGYWLGMEHTGFSVVDADGETGVNTLNKVMPILPEPSVVQRTVSGGIHFIIAGAVADGESRDVRALPGLDILTGANKGFLVVAPSPGYSVLIGSFEQLAEDMRELNDGLDSDTNESA